MDRRGFLKNLGIGAVSLAVLGTESFAAKKQKGKAKASIEAATAPAVSNAMKASAGTKPNIVLIIADDLSWHDMSCYGNKDVKTPNIDKVAKEGMLFNRAFTSTAMCAPTRQQLYTGIYPVRNGAYPNHSKVKAGTKSLVHYFKDDGYRVALYGKTHIGPADSFPFERIKGTDVNKTEGFVSRDKSQPFFLVVASHNPHGPWDKPRIYDPTKLTLYPYMVDTKQTREGLADYYSEIHALDEDVKKVEDILDKNGLKDNTILIFTSEQGSSMPHSKWTCYDVGLHVGFLVRWPGKVKAGSTTDAMVEYVDVVPTLLEAAGAKSIDGLDGKSFLPVLMGKSNHHKDVVFGVHTTKGIINATPSGYPVRSIRSEKYKYIMNLNHTATFNDAITGGGDNSILQSWKEKGKSDAFAAKMADMYQHRPAEEFYDIVADPFEINNLSDKPEYRKTMDEMKKQLEAWMVQQGDKGMATELAVKKKASKTEAAD